MDWEVEDLSWLWLGTLLTRGAADGDEQWPSLQNRPMQGQRWWEKGRQGCTWDRPRDPSQGDNTESGIGLGSGPGSGLGERPEE